MRVHIYYFPSNTASIAFIEPDTRKDVFSIILGRVALGFKVPHFTYLG